MNVERLVKLLLLPTIIFVSIFFSDKSLNDVRIYTVIDNKEQAIMNSTSTTLVSRNQQQTQQQQQEHEHCSLWEDNQDDWWQEHPDWQPSSENDTHLCFTPMRNKERAEYYRRMYEIQFLNTNNCTNIFQRVLIGTGFAAAVAQLTIGFFYAHVKMNQTFVRSKHWWPFKWMYNPPFNTSLSMDEQEFGACDSQDIFCYYLPVTKCNYSTEIDLTQKVPNWFISQSGDMAAVQRNPNTTATYRHHISYFTRLNQETRHQLYKLFQDIAPPAEERSKNNNDCVAFHVRRTDATTEGQHPRKFYYLQEYLDGAATVTNLTKGDTIVLLTDDQSTIDEAKYLHPEYNWLYINRTRHFGATKKNQHLPSNSPSLEFLNIYADFKMAAPCHTLVHGTSNMVTFIVHAMEEAMADRAPDGDFSGLIKTVQIDRYTKSLNFTREQGTDFTKELIEKINAAKEAKKRRR